VKTLTAESRDFASLLPSQADEALPEDDLFGECPSAAYRGLAFVMLFNLLLIFIGALLFETHIL
jgi:hypothetical protein